MPVGPSATASASGLNTEQVVENGDYEIVMEVFTFRVLYHKRDNAEAVGVKIAENLNIGVWIPARNCSTN